ncbi:hypothetical protein [Kribbella sindirgiensis]|uniref:Uncharacterized protein n=1 Tax=Kribbella sindirgiensis TaxID=1124744 RepID=A0A4R0IRF6_9ACTN|nr:hypothetical protein [Kribbella sindirgiensis]TCC31225.1 hypothetical protein E0H50_21285 [Kribbella sindirgiensis]
MDEDVLRCSVHDLVLTFRDGLRAFVPIADRLVMPWHDAYQHPDWERVAWAMFDSIVRSPIEIETGRIDGEHPLVKYDIDVDSYVGASWIAVHLPDRDGALPMIRLTSNDLPFDSVQAAVVDPVSLERTDSVEVPLEGVRFVYIRRAEGVPDVEVRAIEAYE